MKPIIAAFDFDGTLTYRDTLLFFLIHTHGIARTFWNLLLQFPTLVLSLLGGIKRQEIKECILTQFYKDMPAEEMRRQGEIFAEVLDKLIRP
jgi:hypothetical protein